MVSAAITGADKGAADAKTFLTGSVKSIKSSEFGDIMAKSLNSNAGMRNASANVSADAVKTVQGSVQNKGNVVQNQVTEKDMQADSVVRAENVQNDSANDVVVSQETAEQIKETAQEIAERIQEELGISDEELANAMAVLGMTMLDLLEPANITQLVMQVAGIEDAAALLINEDMSLALKDILTDVRQKVEELTQSLDVSEVSLKDMVQQADVSSVKNSTQEQTTESVLVQTDAEQADNAVEAAPEESMAQAVAEKLTVRSQNSGRQQAGQSNEQQTQAQTGNADAGSTVAQFTQQISQTFESVFTANAETANPVDIVRQVVDAIKLTNTQTLQRMEIQLNPENLGKVNVMVTVREGVVTAQITAQNEQVKQALENQMITLKENFQNQGVKVDAVEVTVQSHGFEANQNFTGQEQQNETGKARRRIRLDDLAELEGSDILEETQPDTLQVHENSSVEFTA